jgi:hypothetical protein
MLLDDLEEGEGRQMQDDGSSEKNGMVVCLYGDKAAAVLGTGIPSYTAVHCTLLWKNEVGSICYLVMCWQKSKQAINDLWWHHNQTILSFNYLPLNFLYRLSGLISSS